MVFDFCRYPSHPLGNHHRSHPLDRAHHGLKPNEEQLVITLGELEYELRKVS